MLHFGASYAMSNIDHRCNVQDLTEHLHKQIALNTVYVDRMRASHIVLPIVRGRVELVAGVAGC
ncbi:MAG: hypothetical protein IT531_08020 [Burkholderiales bacterium]|nr:hypothetical protein [Burkholderiales bacterium]